MRLMPRWIRPDATAEFLLLGYRFIGRACDRAGGDRADVVLLGRPTVVLRGREAARLIYNEHLFHRAGALPLRAQRTLTGVGGVQGLDGPTHRERKALFVDLLDEAAAQAIAALFVADWRERLESRPGRAVSVLDSSSLSLCAAVSAWCGMPVAGGGLVARNRDLRAMIESAARVGPGCWSTCTAPIGTRANALTRSPSTPAGSRPRRSPPGRFPLPQPRACSWSSRPESARPCSD